MADRSPDEMIPTQRGSISVADLRSRCRVLEPGVLYFLEIPQGTVPAFDVEMATLRELGKDFESFVVVVDLTEATRPRPELIEHILQCIQTVGIHWCVVKPGNVFMRSVIRFVVGRMASIRSRMSMHESIEEAVRQARKKLEMAKSA